MGWLNGKKLIIRPADGATKSLDNEPHVTCKGGCSWPYLFIQSVCRVLHKASRRDARSVAMTGTSSEAQQYVARYIDSMFQLGGFWSLLWFSR